MKKYLMCGFAAVALCAAFTSCSKNNDVFDPTAPNPTKQQTPEEKIVSSYEQAYEDAFGQPGANQDWGLSKYGTPKASTRSLTINNDVYDVFTIPSASEREAVYNITIPENADEVSDLLTKYQGTTVGTQTLYDLYAIYMYKITAGYNLKITKAGTFDVGGCQNSGWDASQGKNVVRYYNVYVDVDGDVVINRPQDSHFNLYIKRGNVSLGSTQASELSSQAIVISEGCTFTDPRANAAANDGVVIYNKGTYHATNAGGFDIGNNCIVYNEGDFNVDSDLHYSAGAGLTPTFYNIGDVAELTAASMTMNSNCHFFNEGIVDIDGLTKVTKDEIYWVNNGHYTTGTMEFSAKNETFYNYCNLIVEGHAKFYCGKLSLMDNSYTEVGSANLGQEKFRIIMGNNAGFNALGNVRFEKNQDGTEQGFFATGDNAYVRIDGKAQVEKHKYVFVLDGNITYGIKDGVENLEPLDEYYGPYSEFRSNTIEVPANKFNEFTATAKTDDCGATWTVPGEPEENITYQGRIMGEDLTAMSDNDFDFNDVVFDWAISADKKTAYIKLYAAGGTLPLKIGTAVGQGEEVHALFKVPTSTMVNTGVGADGVTKEPVEFTLTGTFNSAADIIVSVDKTSKGAAGYMQMTAKIGQAPCLLFIPLNTKWVDEYENIEKAYTWFGSWSRGEISDKWSEAPVEKYVNLKLSDNN